jgi:hypothetical protein
MDDDCLPEKAVDLIGEYKEGFRKKYPVSQYFDIGHVFGLKDYMRGFPFRDRDRATPLIQYGGWDNVPDLDARTQMGMNRSGEGLTFNRVDIALPLEVGFTGCGMNVAFLHEATPLMYQPIMGMERVGYDRWDDIWCGLIAKRICDHLGYPIVINGKAVVNHSRASDPKVNLVKEQRGYEYNEVMWERIKKCSLKSRTIRECYTELIGDPIETPGGIMFNNSLFSRDWFGPRGERIVRGIMEWSFAFS